MLSLPNDNFLLEKRKWRSQRPVAQGLAVSGFSFLAGWTPHFGFALSRPSRSPEG
jgi:hypothetical protein